MRYLKIFSSPYLVAFLGAKAPLEPLDVKVKVKVEAKKFRKCQIMLKLLDDLSFCLGHLEIMVDSNNIQY